MSRLGRCADNSVAESFFHTIKAEWLYPFDFATGSSNATRMHSTMKDFYHRLLEAGKPKKLALIAVARKLLVASNAIARDRNAWQA